MNLILLNNLPLALILGSNLILGAAFYLYFRRFKRITQKHESELLIREKELKRRNIELSVLRSLGERVGYSLDIKQILDVITGSLKDLVSYSTVSYMLLGPQGKMIFKVQVEESVSHQFIDQVRTQMLGTFSSVVNQKVEVGLTEETVSGASLEEGTSSTVGSSFNLPLIIGGQIAALINVSSSQPHFYGDGEKTILNTILQQVNLQATKLVQVVENEKRRLSAMVSSLADGVVMVDTNFNLLVNNPAVFKMFPLKGGQNLFNLMASVSNFVDLHGAIRQAMMHQNMVKLPEFEIMGKAVQIDVEPVKDKYGYLLGAAVVFHDVTGQKELEKLKEEFTAMMVHELRTPLTTIKYSVASLADQTQVKPEELKASLDIIKSTTANMLSLVTDLLDVARIEAGKFEVVEKEDDLKSLIEEKLATFKPLTQDKHLHLEAEIDPHVTLVKFDRKRVGQALDNLLSNAIKYTDQGKVKIKVERVDHHLVVSVVDSGEGIKQEDLAKLFSKFGLLGKGKTGEKIGTGLGLVITKGIIEAHGGKVWATSKGLGQGSTFAFSLPIFTS